MKKFLLASAALVVLSAPALAADLAARPYTKAAPVPHVAAANWTGLYVGAFGGYGWSDRVRASNVFVGGGSVASNDLKGGFGGITVGYNWQAPGSQFVWGVEVDAAGGNIGASATDSGVTTKDSIRAFGSVTGRVGFAANSALIYVKGGYAWANNKVSVSAAGINLYSESNTHSGWTIGGGLEYMFAPNWSAKAEYMYADYGKKNYGAGLVVGGIDVGASVHTIKAGVNYRFN
ncbi:MAG TPA: outer membrane beta-barrel protein [Xanthobacteraceae bacterium]|nr:outer membrane beta-barrel protein [Xanthobacteraceae bacterium]